MAKFGASGDLPPPVYFLHFFRWQKFLCPFIFFLRKRCAKEIANERVAEFFYRGRGHYEGIWGGVPEDGIPPKICPEDGIPNFWVVEDRIRTGLEDGIRPKNGFGGRNTAQNKAELEDEIDPQTPSYNRVYNSTPHT